MLQQLYTWIFTHSVSHYNILRWKNAHSVPTQDVMLPKNNFRRRKMVKPHKKIKTRTYFLLILFRQKLQEKKNRKNIFTHCFFFHLNNKISFDKFSIKIYFLNPMLFLSAPSVSMEDCKAKPAYYFMKDFNAMRSLMRSQFA